MVWLAPIILLKKAQMASKQNFFFCFKTFFFSKPIPFSSFTRGCVSWFFQRFFLFLLQEKKILLQSVFFVLEWRLKSCFFLCWIKLYKGTLNVPKYNYKVFLITKLNLIITVPIKFQQYKVLLLLYYKIVWTYQHVKSM